MITFEDFVKIFTLTLARGVEVLSAVLVAVSVVHSIAWYTRNVVQGKVDGLKLRLGLGKSLALALEFLLAADILRTAVAPTWDELGKLAAIAALRTFLNYFLERELNEVELRKSSKII